MAVATIWPEGSKGGRGKKDVSANMLESGRFSRQLRDKARVVLRWAPELGKPVLLGARSLDDAFEIAKGRQREVYSSPE
jgi:hypothetical protein